MKYNAGSDGRFNAVCYNIIPGYGLHIYKEYSTKEKAQTAFDEIQKWSDAKKAKEFGITESQAHYGFTTLLSFIPGPEPELTAEEKEEATFLCEKEPWKMPFDEEDKMEEKEDEDPA